MSFTCCSLSPGGAKNTLDALLMCSHNSRLCMVNTKFCFPSLTRDLCVKSLIYQFSNGGMGFRDKLVGFKNTVSLSLQQMNLSWIVFAVHHSSSAGQALQQPVPLLPQELFNLLEMSSDPVTHKLVSAISLAIKKDVFLST